MGLDIYVGSLTRYYLGDWETIIQQYGREMGIEVQIDRHMQRKPSLLQRLIGFFRPSGPKAAAVAVEKWRQQLEKQLGKAVEWNDDADADYFTDKPGWDCYGALLLWAAYDELPHAKRAETAAEWDLDPAYEAVSMNERSRYRHLTAGCELWLPVDFEQPIDAYPVAGDEVSIGSSIALQRELQELNRRTWNADDAQLAQWREEGAESTAPLETAARFAFAILQELTRQSVLRRLPMKLDY
jgi:hypothetical protein